MAQRCSACNVDYPNYREFETCPICSADTWKHTADFDSDYRDRIHAAHAPKSALQLAGLYPHDPEARVQIYQRRGRKFIRHQDLLDVGYLNLEDFSIVYVNGTFYELQGHGPSYRLTGKYDPGGVWWVEPISLTFKEETL